MRYCGVACGQFRFSLRPQARIVLSQVNALLRARPGNTIPSISPMCAQARRRFTQVMHMVMHSKADNTFSCRAGRQRAGAGGAGPHRRPGSAADHRPGKGRCRGAGPRRRPCSRRRGTQSCGLGLRRVPHGSGVGPRRPFGNLARARLDPRSSRHFCGRRGAGPGKTFRPGRIRHGPSMYEMEGPCPAAPSRLASCLVFAERRAPPAGARYPREGPVSRLLPRSRRRPRVVPVSSGESIITTAASTAQDPDLRKVLS